jgi:hypothetical protein
MFVPDEQMERAVLRQGDIIGRIPFPLLEVSDMQVLAQIQSVEDQHPYPTVEPSLITHRQNPNYFIGQVKMCLSFGVVLSHCCELELRHGNLIGAAFCVGRLVQIRDNIRRIPEKLASLRENPDPRRNEPPGPGYIDYFYIEAHEHLARQDWMVDFSQVISFPKSEYGRLLGLKRLQMDDTSRMKLKIKLTTYYGRVLEGEPLDPWNSPPTVAE